MTQDTTANFFTFSNHDGSMQISYYPQAPGPIIVGQTHGPRLEYQGPEGNFVYPEADPGRNHIDVQEGNPFGLQVSVVLVPTVDAKAVTLTLLVPPIILTGRESVDFHTLAIKTTSYGILPHKGARLTYEEFHLKGKAQNIILPLVVQQ